MSVVDNIRFTFLYIEFYSMGRTWVYPESVIPYSIFRYIEKGKAELCIDGEEIIVEENQIVYIPQGCKMSCRALGESFEFYSLRFTTSVFYEGEDMLAEYYGIPRVSVNEGEDVYFKEIYKWVKKDSMVKKCFVRGNLDLLIGSLAMHGNKVDKVTGDFVETIEEKSLRDRNSKTPMEYVREIRLTTAARALLVSNDNINDIAYACGYEDTNYFIREFKSAFGFTPNQYRKVARE